MFSECKCLGYLSTFFFTFLLENDKNAEGKLRPAGTPFKKKQLICVEINMSIVLKS